ncbi:sigma-70 family RNA polymerase sigma factor [Sphingomonas koreensis]|jgi:RNA polymerase sigma factor (sigma-70 family)|uniref:RNA polymerase subunit sigma-24 n=1 Tax=Sphingomonas koreensis TaxID=93064 RepID=A0A1L6J5V3_9SPHN|nr:sigma-70 family RNA polymerase sigma factor [Sphingomonas koreensis]APR51299.1 RNA polymerase subunit sigma-24 [Sphingomonas koreensis]MDC7810367.1 sigma-70 family RNA polymerase sigma factor [Sphingomonas koreensis]RSU17586.1 sigma-70 family RNA polymerase sigma factor [Sphingomonas koreensis]RSU21842.1 sigma-70 family RNA polymerase sigma factor [Sphingomonas koreensis]RSU26209.1 sigma-70 family RNA polymerase sigma factor [Sphingomonas koreensis]
MADRSDDPDADLLAGALAGDREAFGLLLERHYDRIHGLAWQLTGSRADADDIAQDVCCVLVERIGTFRGEARFTTWLCGIVFNACRDLHRRRRSFGGFTRRLSVLAALARGPDGRDLHDAMWVKSAIAGLPAAYRDTVVLVAGQQLTHAEAAAILGIAEATVSWRMHEVRRMLAGRPDAGI